MAVSVAGMKTKWLKSVHAMSNVKSFCHTRGTDGQTPLTTQIHATHMEKKKINKIDDFFNEVTKHQSSATE